MLLRLLILIQTSILLTPIAQAEQCPPAPKVVLSETKSNGSQLFRYEQWSGNNASLQLQRGLKSNTPFLDAHNEAVKRGTEVDPVKLLLSKLKFWPNSPRFIEIAQGRVGKIVALSCLEKVLMEAHLKRYKKGEIPYSELGAHVLVQASDPENFVVEISFGNADGAVSGGGHILERSIKLQKDGWRYLAHVHNHPFNLKNPSGDHGGSIVPSGNASYGDISVFVDHVKKHHMESAAITNGFNTTILTSSEILGPVSGWDD